MTPFVIKTVQNTNVIIAPPSIEAIATSDTGCAIYMASGTIWHVSETADLLLDRILVWGDLQMGGAQ